MKTPRPLQPGFHAVPPGMLATIVTYLEMTSPAPPRAIADADRYELRAMSADVDDYRRLFRAVGEDWLWVSRLKLTDDALCAVLQDGDVELFELMRDGKSAGILELDFRAQQVCEIAFFGVVPQVAGTTAARHLMNEAIALAWRVERGVERVFLHTCTLDHPRALAFYRRSGFNIYKHEVEVLADPRLEGTCRRDAAPHVPLAAG